MQPLESVRVCSTADYTALDVSVLHQPALPLNKSLLQQSVLSLDMPVCLFYISLFYCLRRCLACSFLCFIWTYLFNSSLCRAFEVYGLHLDVSVFKTFVLHLYVSAYKSVLHLDMSAYRSFVMHLELSVYKSLCYSCTCLPT